MLGEFTPHQSEMMVQRDLRGVATLAVYAAIARERKYSEVSYSTNSLLAQLPWNPTFKQLLNNMIDTERLLTFRDVVAAVTDLPPVEESEGELSHRNGSTAGRLSFPYSSPRGDALGTARGNVEKSPDPESPDSESPHPDYSQLSVNHSAQLAHLAASQSSPPRGFMSVSAVHEQSMVSERGRAPAVKVSSSRVKYAKPFNVPASLVDDDDIDYSKSGEQAEVKREEAKQDDSSQYSGLELGRNDFAYAGKEMQSEAGSVMRAKDPSGKPSFITGPKSSQSFFVSIESSFNPRSQQSTVKSHMSETSSIFRGPV